MADGKIHIRIVSFGQAPQTVELPEGATLERALATVNKTYSPVTVRVGGKLLPPQAPLQDGQIVVTDIPTIQVAS